MDPPSTPSKPKRTQCVRLQSRYFSTPKRKDTTSHPPSQLVLSPSTPRTTSCFFEPKLDIDGLLSDPSFTAFYEQFVSSMLDLFYAKPLLIQEYVLHSPWKVLVAVTLLNKTAGQKAIPVFFEVMEHWPTPAALAEAPLSLLFELLKDLGLGDMRSQRLVDISQAFLSDPPQAGILRPSPGRTTALLLSDDSIVVKDVKYPPTPISHIPGCGPYALDSYRIFCTGGDEWRSVRPTDKELVKYLQWRWAVEAYRKWDQTSGPGDSIDLDYIRNLTASLTKHPIAH
ncbi:hypothetical protein DICSQDRAFT_73043 [Dichomitus squalens LYAD-421 SS1]|uniref:DNA glycosylase n=1 Tax=Dichomitus squalens (strain LYAD-421) TaxID=732165 RepID=R7SJ49_DICSQ|nr:uncharacterized protein DICSQDRAFT_73043 [Dichomitus squalens LYAD-421 SS1]EJF55730.1 hypothetical protein DICSQDRAFT_73043 [Dichomitus squalens LYAD-421 SS1]